MLETFSGIYTARKILGNNTTKPHIIHNIYILVPLLVASMAQHNAYSSFLILKQSSARRRIYFSIFLVGLFEFLIRHTRDIQWNEWIGFVDCVEGKLREYIRRNWSTIFIFPFFHQIVLLGRLSPWKSRRAKKQKRKPPEWASCEW